MPNNVLTVVVSQGQSRNPEKRSLEEGIIASVPQLSNAIAIVVPHLYDLDPKGASFDSLRGIDGPMVVFSWLFERAAHWVLDRNGVRGQVGEIELKDLSEEDEDEDEDEDDAEGDEEEDAADRVASQQARPDRKIYCIDLRVRDSLQPFLDELSRIHAEWIESRSRSDDGEQIPSKHGAESNKASGTVSQSAIDRLEHPWNSTALASDGSGRLALDTSKLHFADAPEPVITIAEHPNRRWYPVIDFSRCTNCMECIDFCLFGVYGVDGSETILVEQPDNCRKGCPACSRVCPANAIMFPQHKTPAIAGANVDAGSMKIDLSKLFGAPDRDEDPVAAAARERDEQLILAGRQAVGATGIGQGARTSAEANGDEKELAANPVAARPKDDFDQLLDQLDSLDL